MYIHVYIVYVCIVYCILRNLPSLLHVPVAEPSLQLSRLYVFGNNFTQMGRTHHIEEKRLVHSNFWESKQNLAKLENFKAKSCAK